MEYKLIQNNGKENHISQLVKMAKKSDTLIIVSPFLTDSIELFLQQMPTIKNVTIYTTLDKFDDTVQKTISLYSFNEYCKKNNIDLVIKIDEDLHGKVYLLYAGATPRGFVLTSGNFTEKGLKQNHEYGVAIEDEVQQKKMAEMIMNLSTYDIKEKELNILYSEATAYIKKHSPVEQSGFKAKKIIDKKPSGSQTGDQHFYIKPVGTSKDPFMPPNTLRDNDVTGFNNNPKNMKKGDVLICHSVGPSNVVGYYSVADDEADYNKKYEEDRWPWKIHVECHSGKFSSGWWNYELKTFELAKEFLEKNPGKHITAVGTDSLGALQRGNDKLQITKDFALFILNRIEEVQN